MRNENALLNINQEFNGDDLDSFDFDELEEKLEMQLEQEFADMEFLKEEREKIGNPDNLGSVIMDVVWDQFINQIAVVAGEDFIKENNGLKLDLRNEAHIQTGKNFENGKIATHNTKINYQERHDEWEKNFQKDPGIEHKTSNYRYNEEQNVWEKHDPRSKSWKRVLNKGARDDFDKRRPTGNSTSNTNMDHTISAGEIIRDPNASAHMTREELVAFANSDKNLNLMDSAANQSKGDSTTPEFLESERDGKKAAERFNIDEENLRKKDKEAREEYEKKKKEAENKSIEAGKQSQKEEAFRIGGKALRAVIMQLLAEVVKEIIAKLVKWFKSAKKNLESLLESIREAIHSFIGKLKTHIVNAGSTIFSTVVTAIIGPIFATIKKVWMLLKQGWKSLKDAVNYLKNPANKEKPIGRLLLETGKIVIAGLTGAGALVLGELIEKGLMTIPIFAFEIPLIGSLASILGIFFGAVVAGIIGAIALNLIEKKIEKNMKSEATKAQVTKGNDIMNRELELISLKNYKLEKTKENISKTMSERNRQATEILKQTADEMKSSLDSINKNKSNIQKLMESLRED